MARTLNDIQESILRAKKKASELDTLEVLTTNERNTIAGLTSTSRVAIWRLWIWVVAVVVWTLESIFDIHKKEMDDLIKKNKIHNFTWYEELALAFQFGHALVTETDKYNNSTLTIAQIDAAKIIKHVAVIRKIVNGRGHLELKLAKEVNNEYVPLEPAEMLAFEDYIKQTGDAGTKIIPTSRVNDSLKLVLDIHYNPQILSAAGARLDGTANTPVQEAIKSFLYNLDFNGELVLTQLTDHLQLIEGVKLPIIKSAETKYGNLEWATINETYISDAGYMRMDEGATTINWIARGQ